jgi:hypothetical protein
MTETAVDRPTPPGSQDEIVAGAGTYYRVTRFIMTLLLLGLGGWFLYDGYIGYPAENQAAIERGHEPPHSEWSLFLQRALGWTLPPLGVLMLVWTLYNSRGTYRLSGNTLQIPGHPPVDLDEIVRVDRSLWDRKGIAYIDYEIADGRAGKMKLDDFVYDREPTDRIFERIEQHLLPPDEQPGSGAPAQAEPPPGE